MIDEDLSYFFDDNEDDYDEDELAMWTTDDWLASGIETSADWHQYFDQDYVRLTSLSPPNSTDTLDHISSQTLRTDSSSSSSSLIYSLIDLTENCISPSISQLVNQLYWIVLFCILFRLLYISKIISSTKLHYLQIVSSLFVLYTYFHFQSIFLLTYVLIGYSAFQLCLEKCRYYLTHIIVYFSIIYVLACEFLLIEQEKWHAIRGVQMCLMMKMISLAIDHRYFERISPTNTEQSIINPTAIEFFSYILSIHNTIFGPWMNYRNYIRYFHENTPSKKIDFFELTKGVYYFLRIVLCLLVSTCFTDWIFRNSLLLTNHDQDDESQPTGWRIAYIHALSYRFSHYCVCFIGEFTGHISGLDFNVDEYRNYSDICQQAHERKIREQAEFEATIMTNDSHPSKRRHRNKKHSNKSDELDAMTIDEQQQQQNSSQNNTMMENGSSLSNESECLINDESDFVSNRSLVNRRTSKKSPVHPVLPPTTKRKLSLRTNSSQPSSISFSTKSTLSHSSAIVKPSHIELPHSLVDVVVNWNLPMHYWLKIYVYIPMKQQYGHLASILVTYLASALLHGFNFQLSIVLFSIGLFAYVEYGFRRKLATILDACVAARSCPLRTSCEKHTHTYWHPLTIIVNTFLCLLSLWHLTYLGQLFDGSSQETIGYSWQHVLEKWSKLNFASHLVVIGTYAIFRSL